MTSRLTTRALTVYCGTEITGALVGDLTDEELQIVRSHAANRSVVILPGQFISPQDEVAFAKRLGKILVPGSFPTKPEAPGLIQITNNHAVSAQIYNRTDRWHTDATHLRQPPSFTVLSCAEPAPEGGDTMWANQYHAYDTLSETMKGMIRGLRLKFVISGAYAPSRNADDPVEISHPLVRVHGETGRKALYIGDDVVTSTIDGLSVEESASIKGLLFQHAQKPENVYRHRWQKGDLAIWDNRCTLHYAVKDYDPTVTRVMNRVMVEGEVPMGDAEADTPVRSRTAKAIQDPDRMIIAT